MSVNFKDIKLFDDKTFEDLVKDIYQKAQKRSLDFDSIMGKLVEMAIQNPSSAANIMPLLSEYSEIAVKNDDSLIKLAGIIQRFQGKAPAESIDSGDWYIPQEEIDRLQEQLQQKVLDKSPIVLTIEESKE